MNLIASMILGFVIDLIVGDPHGLIHPVQIIGWFITKIKEGLQRLIYGCSYESVTRVLAGRSGRYFMRQQKSLGSLNGLKTLKLAK